MTESRMKHRVHDGAFGILHALFGFGEHSVEILDDQGKTIGVGKGPTEPAARAQAWKDVHRVEGTLSAPR